jgi:DNA-binding LacI/PurR family transcriptional regulator
MRSATLQDVADRAGVSRATASSIINGGRSNTRTSPATAERIRKAAEELFYRPNTLARSLRRQTTQTIGFYNGYDYIDFRTMFMNAVLEGLHSQCDQHGCDLLIHRLLARNNETAQFQEIIGGKVDGVVIYTKLNDPILAMIAERRFPAVAIAGKHAAIPSVTADDHGGSRLVAERLAGHHQRILYRLAANRMSSTSRYSAFVEEAEKLGMTVIPGLSSNNFTALSKDEIDWINAPEGVRPTAIVCWSDGSAIEMYRYLRSNGLEDQFAVIGFDGFEYPGLPVKLTSVQVPWDQVGMTAVDTLCKILDGQRVPEHITIPVTISEGDTG